MGRAKPWRPNHQVLHLLHTSVTTTDFSTRATTMSYVPTPSCLPRSGYISDIPTPPAGVVPTTWSVGVLHALDSTLTLPPTNYWLTDVALAPQAIALLQQYGFDGFSFTPFSSAAAWTTANPSEPIESGHITAANIQASTPAPPPARHTTLKNIVPM